MAEKMSFKECVDNRIITKTAPDPERSAQMVKMADIRFKFWNKKIDDEFVALKVEAYYDIIKELIFAILYKKGYNCQNNICLISYIKDCKRF